MVVEQITFNLLRGIRIPIESPRLTFSFLGYWTTKKRQANQAASCWSLRAECRSVVGESRGFVILGGSWVVISGDMSRVTKIITGNSLI